MEITNIKNRLPILTVLSHYHLVPDKHYQIKCPFHDDDKPSMKVYPKTNTVHCFACGKTGDVIQFIQDFEKCTKHEAILKAESFINPPTIPTPKPEKPEPKPEQPTEKPFTELFQYFKESITRSNNAQNYCQQRGLDYKTLEVGYNSAEKWNKLKQCLIFPIKDKNGNITSLYGRHITESKGYSLEYGKHYYSENRSDLYPNYPSPETKTLIITEAIIDAATLLQLPEISNQFTILTAYGTNGLTKEHKAAIAELKQLKEIIFFFDGDTAGREGTQQNAEELKELDCKITAVATPEKEDINSLFVNYGKDGLIQLINERKPINETSFSIEPPLIEEKTDVQTLSGHVSKEFENSKANHFENVETIPIDPQ